MWGRQKKQHKQHLLQSSATVEHARTKAAHSTMLEWQFPSEDEAWERVTALQSATSPDQLPAVRHAHRLRAIYALLILLALGATLYLWSQAESGAQMLEEELRATIAAEVKATQRPSDHQVNPAVRTPATTVPMQEITYHGNIVSVQVESNYTEPNGKSYRVRQRNFYLRTSSGWVRVPPSPDILGTRLSLESDFFTFSYHQLDEASVEAVVAELDALYINLRQDYSLPSAAERMTVVLFNDQTEVDRTEVEFACYRPNHLCLPSPALASLPVELSEREALQLQLLSALVYRVRGDASELARFKYEWQLAEIVLPRMQMRRHSSRLSAWHTEIVRWLYGIQARTPKPDNEMLAQELAHLCDSHQITAHLRLITDVALADLCMAPPLPDLHYLAQYKAPDHLIRFPWPNRTWWVGKQFWLEAMALETLLDYVVVTYGDDGLPKLVDGFRRYETWETLIPAVFGISAEEFEQGWQAYLQNLP
jgi:hypothetical protein